MSASSSRGGIWFVTGTGTDVGKTVVTAALLRALRRRGVDCQAIKAVQSGCERGPGGTLLAPDMEEYAQAAAGAPVHALFRFERPCSPHLAAAAEGRRISARDICSRVRMLAVECAVTLVEGAGGTLVPINEKETIADVALGLGAQVILVAANRLGAINETLLSLEAAENRGLTVAAVVFSTPGTDDGTSPIEAEIRRDNIETIRRLAAPLPVFDIDHITGLRDGDPAARQAAWEHGAGLLEPLAKLLAETQTETRAGKHEADLAFDARHLWHPYAPTHPSPRVWHVASTAGNRIRLSDTGRRLHRLLAERGQRNKAPGHIQPVHFGESRLASDKAAELRQSGFYVLPIRPPTVPAGTSRLRLSLTADIGIDHVERLAALL